MNKLINYRNIALLLIIASLLFSCKDEETGFTSLIGSWAYTTPDEKIEMAFDIAGSDTELLVIQNETIKVDGVEGMANLQFDDITETTIKLIRINANDAALVFPYNITFNNLTVGPDFETIDVEEASYTYPWQNTIIINNIQIVRR